MPKRKVISKNKNVPQAFEAKKDELTLEDVEKLFDRVSEGPFSRLEDSLCKLEMASRAYGDSFLSKIDKLQRSISRIGECTFSTVKSNAFLDHRPTGIKVIRGADLRKADIPLSRRTF